MASVLRFYLSNSPRVHKHARIVTAAGLVRS